MKRIYYIILLAVLAASCTPKSSRETTFTITVHDIHATKSRVKIESSNPDAYYSYGHIREDMEPYFSMSDMENARFQIDFCKEMMEYGSEEIDKSLSYVDKFCFRGTQEFRQLFLNPDQKNKVVVFQVDPKTLDVVGTPVSTMFQTKPLKMSDITFSITFGPDKVTIVPSNNDEYYWDYENTETILAEYVDAIIYLQNLIFMYEDYGFMNSGVTDHGTVEWVFSEEDSTMVDGERCTLAICGYADGEINTDITTIEFIYHKDKPCEIVTPQE